jgi:hypothetical protein
MPGNTAVIEPVTFQVQLQIVTGRIMQEVKH